MPIPELLQLADDLAPWAPLATPAILFGVKQASAIAKRFQEHYKHDAPETREAALESGADAARRLRDEVNGRVERGELTEEQVRLAFQRPDIAKHAQDALLSASETSDTLAHDELARLIGARLVAPQDSRLNVLLRMACDQLRYLDSRQLRLLGLTYAVVYVQPPREIVDGRDAPAFDAAYERYLMQVERWVSPFWDLPAPIPVEFMHFEELNLAKLTSWTASLGLHKESDVTRSGLLSHLEYDFHAKFRDPETPPNPKVQWIFSLMRGNADDGTFGLQAANLTPIGFLIGQCMFCIAHGCPFDPTNNWLSEPT